MYGVAAGGVLDVARVVVAVGALQARDDDLPRFHELGVVSGGGVEGSLVSEPLPAGEGDADHVAGQRHGAPPRPQHEPPERRDLSRN